jgi:hypothetical protein
MKPSAAKNTTTTNLGKIFWIIVEKKIGEQGGSPCNGHKIVNYLMDQNLSYIES